MGESGEIPAFDNFPGYVYGAIRHRILDLVEQEQRQLYQLMWGAHELYEPPPDTLDVAQREQQNRIYLDFIARLPPLEFKVIKLFLQYHSKAEVARQLNLTIDVVRGVIERAERKLREMFDCRQPRAPGSDHHGN